MPSNDSSVAGEVTFQAGDDLSESNLTKRAAKTNSSDYVERGLGFAVDDAAGTVDINSGYAIVRDGTQAYDVEPDQATDVTLPDGAGVNYVYLAIEPGTDNSIYYHLDTDKSAPTDPALYLGTADGSDGSSTELNRRPDVKLGDADIERLATALDANGQEISNVGAFDASSVSTGDGTIGGDPMLGGPDSSSNVSISLGSGWTEVDSNNPVFFALNAYVETDGSTRGEVIVEVDESGGSTADYRLTNPIASPGLGSGGVQREFGSTYLPPGATVRAYSNGDPNNNNQLQNPKKFVL